MKYTRPEASVLSGRARELRLSGAELLDDLEAVMRECNGIGADWMPVVMTKLCTKLNPVMEVPAAIHDRRYMTRGITRSDADLEFLTNTLKVIKDRYAWWNPWRYLMMRRAVRYYSYLVMFGDMAWEEAKKKK